MSGPSKQPRWKHLCLVAVRLGDTLLFRDLGRMANLVREEMQQPGSWAELCRRVGGKGTIRRLVIGGETYLRVFRWDCLVRMFSHLDLVDLVSLELSDWCQPLAALADMGLVHQLETLHLGHADWDSVLRACKKGLGENLTKLYLGSREDTSIGPFLHLAEACMNAPLRKVTVKHFDGMQPNPHDASDKFRALISRARCLCFMERRRRENGDPALADELLAFAQREGRDCVPAFFSRAPPPDQRVLLWRLPLEMWQAVLSFSSGHDYMTSRSVSNEYYYVMRNSIAELPLLSCRSYFSVERTQHQEFSFRVWAATRRRDAPAFRSLRIREENLVWWWPDLPRWARDKVNCLRAWARREFRTLPVLVVEGVHPSDTPLHMCLQHDWVVREEGNTQQKDTRFHPAKTHCPLRPEPNRRWCDCARK